MKWLPLTEYADHDEDKRFGKAPCCPTCSSKMRQEDVQAVSKAYQERDEKVVERKRREIDPDKATRVREKDQYAWKNLVQLTDEHIREAENADKSWNAPHRWVNTPMEKMMECLTDEERQVCVLHFAEEVSVRVIAEELGLSRSAVERRLKSAEKKFKAGC